MFDYYVYILFHPTEFYPFYVGKGRKYRFLAHKSDFRGNPGKVAIMREAAALGVDVPTVVVRADLSEDDAFAIEREFISAIGRAPAGTLVNLNDGGRGGGNLSAEARERLAASARVTSTGRKHNSETLAKMSSAAKRRPINPDLAAINSIARRGSKASPETIEKMRAAMLGRSHVPGQTEKISAALRERQPSDRTKEGHRQHFATLRAARANKDCPQCGVSFSPNRKAQAFCGKKCSSTSNAWKRYHVDAGNEGQSSGGP